MAAGFTKSTTGWVLECGESQLDATCVFQPSGVGRTWTHFPWLTCYTDETQAQGVADYFNELNKEPLYWIRRVTLTVEVDEH